MSLSIVTKASPNALPKIEQPTPHAEAYIASPRLHGVEIQAQRRRFRLLQYPLGNEIGDFLLQDMKRNAFVFPIRSENRGVQAPYSIFNRKNKQ